jgi:hypothetical protein
MCESVQKHQGVDLYFQNEVEALSQVQESEPGDVDEGCDDDRSAISRWGFSQRDPFWLVGLGEDVDFGW